jgi:hypothetical protein
MTSKAELQRRFGNDPRLLREARTLRIMVALYCRDHHHPPEPPCAECERLLEYALGRLGRCVFGAGKPVCSACPIHCYRREERERIREIMRYAGPRMLSRHPILAVRHLLAERRARRSPPELPRRGSARRRTVSGTDAAPQEGGRVVGAGATSADQADAGREGGGEPRP